MQFNRLDKKIKEASGQYQPGYDEQAWTSMERLLDKHLPQKKERKKMILWLWTSLVLIIISGIAMVVSDSSTTKLFKSSKQKIIQPNANNFNLVSIKEENKATSIKINSENKVEKENNFLPKNIALQKFYSSAISSLASNPVIQNTNLLTADVDQIIGKENNKRDNNDDFFTKQLKREEDFRDRKIIDLAQSPICILSNKKINSSPDKIALHPDKNKFKSYVAFNLSAGPDVSAANIGNVGKTNIIYGAGITYQFAKRWNIRTGFYVVKKVYAAKPSDYHPPSSFWIYYPDLKSIDANCKVYEVPLSVSYTINDNKKQKWFASAGLSSYFMKKETYDYVSKTTSGQDEYRRYSIDNQNKHYLSSLRLSGGYEKKINDKISIGAEPYINLPLAGVGFGKVKLKSTGVLVTLGIKIFSKK